MQYWHCVSIGHLGYTAFHTGLRKLPQGHECRKRMSQGTPNDKLQLYILTDVHRVVLAIPRYHYFFTRTNSKIFKNIRFFHLSLRRLGEHHIFNIIHTDAQIYWMIFTTHFYLPVVAGMCTCLDWNMLWQRKYKYQGEFCISACLLL